MGLGDLKKSQVVNVIQVKDTWGDGQSGFYDFDANGAPAVGAVTIGLWSWRY